MRSAGILMPIASLPSDYGIGDFGKYSYQFVDMLQKTKITIWQILPLNPLGYGNSPYQPYSSYAGDELYISLDALEAEGLIHKPLPFQKKSTQIDYQRVREYKKSYLEEAFQQFKPTKAYQNFVKAEWVYEYGVFLALKKQNNLICWNEWPEEQKNWIIDKKYDLTPLKENIEYEMFLQYLFFDQWMKLKNYANKRGVQIMGDIPFYVGIDSLDVWTNQNCFLLDADSKPTFVAGVPPDYFSATGQRWGNPIYDWDYLREQKFQFWVDRLAYCDKMFDIVRIDHFRAFDTYWNIPASCETAIEGEWLEAPGYEIFDVINKKLSHIQIVVEDLGDLREEVHVLRDHYDFKGMKVLQFAFDPKETNNDFNDRENMIIYTGTHDNQTIRGWYRTQPKTERKHIRRALKKSGYVKGPISWKFIQMAFRSIGDMAIIPMQDFINLGDAGRINTPGTLGSPNWEWKLKNLNQFGKNVDAIRLLVEQTKVK